ncbi:S-layer family protein, partial [Candidatus Micrarchaeota archaeon]|nr:S-layer family protein [Candidatus Micrarchaeota archaeon]
NSVAPTLSRIATIPALSGNDTFAFLGQTQTFTNKKLDSTTTSLTDTIYNTKLGQFDLSTITTGTSRTYTLPDSTGTICLSTGNCAGSGGSVAGSGTNNRLAKFTSTGSNIGDSSISDNGSLVSFTSDLALTGTNPSLSLGAADSNETFAIKDTAASPHTLLSLVDNGTTGTLNVNTISTSNLGGYNLTGNITGSGTPNISGLGSISGGSSSLTNTTNQLVLGTTNTTTINSVAPTLSRIATIPALSGNDTFAFLGQTQTFTNKKLDSTTTSLTDTITICLSTGNCAGSGGSVGGSGTQNHITKFTATGSSIGDSTITDDGSTVSFSNNLALTATSPLLTLATIGNNGTLTIKDAEASPNTLLTLTDNGATGTLAVNTISTSNIGSVTANGNITGSGTPTLSGFGTINGATISGGALSGGTYTNSGATVTGNFTTTIGNTGSFNISDGTNTLFTLSDGGTAGNLSGLNNLTAAGTITFSGLATNGIVTTTGGVLSSETTITPAQGGTGINGSTAANGSLLIGNGAGYTLASLTGTANQINVTNGTGSITLALPQDIATTSTPTFANENLTSATNQLVLGTTNTTTINSVAPTLSRIATIPALSSNDTFAFLNQSQTLTNKTLIDNSTTFANNTDNTKAAKLDLSTVTTGTTRTLTVPNQNGTIAVAATSPIALDATTGTISCPTCLASSNVVTSLNSLTGGLTISGGGINTISTVGSTITVTGTEADTLQSVTTRGASSDQTVILSNTAPLAFSATSPVLTIGASDTNGTFSVKDTAATPNTLLSLQDLGTAGKLTINTIAASNIGAFTATGDIAGNGSNTLSNFASINGATITGGSLTGGSISGGSLTGGTYAATGATVTGGFTTTIGNTNSFNISDGTNNLFTISDAGTVGNLSNIGSITAASLTLSSLNTAGIVVNDASGNISSQAQLSTSRGGTGVDGSLAGNGKLLIGNGAGYSLANLTTGSGIGITNGTGSITIANTGVTALTGTANQINVSGSTGAVTLSLPQSIATTSTPTFGGATLNGGLNITPTTNQLVLGTTNTTTINSVTPTLSRIATIPALSANDTFAFVNEAQTLTNKSIDASTNTQVNVSGSTGAVTFSLPQDIATTSTPTFTGETLTGASPLTLSNINPSLTFGSADSNGVLSIKDSSITPHTLLSLTDNGTTGTLGVNTISASNIGAFNATGNISGNNSNTLSNFASINGATISGGNLSGGSVSGGTLTGGTYSNSGASVTGGFTVTQGAGSTFNISNGTNT